MANQPGGFLGGGQAATAGVPPLPEVLTPADVAKALGVTEADVVATLDQGDLKGRKIGSAWRVTRAALDEFLRS
jgi:excisionase family DNA binding protein